MISAAGVKSLEVSVLWSKKGWDNQEEGLVGGGRMELDNTRFHVVRWWWSRRLDFRTRIGLLDGGGLVCREDEEHRAASAAVRLSHFSVSQEELTLVLWPAQAWPPPALAAAGQRETGAAAAAMVAAAARSASEQTLSPSKASLSSSYPVLLHETHGQSSHTPDSSRCFERRIQRSYGYSVSSYFYILMQKATHY